MRALGVHEYEEGKLTTEEFTKVDGFLGVHGLSTHNTGWKPIQVEVSNEKGYVEIEAGMQLEIYIQDISSSLWNLGRIATALEKLAGIDTKE